MNGWIAALVAVLIVASYGLFAVSMVGMVLLDRKKETDA